MYVSALKSMKERSKMTVKQISEASGIPDATVSRILSGGTEQPSFQAVAAIVIAMGFSLDELIGHAPAAAPAQESFKRCEGDSCSMLAVLKKQKEDDAARYQDMVSRYETRLEKMEHQTSSIVAKKDRWLVRLFCLSLVLAACFIILLILDICVSDVGFIFRQH